MRVDGDEDSLGVRLVSDFEAAEYFLGIGADLAVLGLKKPKSTKPKVNGAGATSGA